MRWLALALLVAAPAFAAEVTKAPTSDIAASGTWDGSAGTRYQALDDHPDSAGTDYRLHGTTAGRLVMGHAAFAIAGGSVINSVSVRYYDYKTSTAGTAVRAGLRVGGTDYYAATHNATNATYVLRTDTWALNPRTGVAWTVDDVNGVGGNALAGFSVGATDANPTVRFASAELVVDWAASTTTTVTTTSTTSVASTSTTSTTLPVLARLLVSFDAVDDGATTATDVLDMVPIETATDADVRAALCSENSARCRDGDNGGGNSLWAGWIDLAAADRGGWEMLAAPVLSASQVTAAFAVHQPSGGGVSDERTIARFMMVGGAQGCRVTLDENEAFRLYYQSTNYGTADQTLYTKTCSADARRGCSVDGDCVSGQTCATCSTSTGAGCFWPFLELAQTNFASGTGDKVQCDLWIDGVLQATSGLVDAASLGLINDFELGGPLTTENATAQLAFDDIVIVANGSRAGNTYLHAMTPINGVLSGATEETCGADGNAVAKCVNDYGVSTNTYRLNSASLDDAVRATAGKNKGADLTRFSPQPTSIPESATIPAVQIALVGRTQSNAGTWVTRTKLAQCASASALCGDTSTASDYSHGQLDTYIRTGLSVVGDPPVATSGAWTLGDVGKVGASWTSLTGNGWIRLGAALATVQVRLPDQQPEPNLLIHHLGDEAQTGKIVGIITGDSTASGTGVSACVGGSADKEICSQATYCSWDITGNKDLPPGGCSSNTDCHTCANRRQDFPGSVGYPCAVTGDCDLGICTGGFCTNDTDVACPNGNSDCQLGACDTSATCIESCPGGTCPAQAGFPYFALYGADTGLNCSAGGQTTPNIHGTDHSGAKQLLYGRSRLQPYGIELCALVFGERGRCECTSNAECGTNGACDKSNELGRCQNDYGKTCTADGDCTSYGGGVCLGVCTASDSGRASCAGRNDPLGVTCATDRVCAWTPPSYVFPATGINDSLGGDAESGPNCRGPYTGGSTHSKPCDNCAETTCANHSACSGISTNSKCFGVANAFGSQLGCFKSTDLACSTDSGACRTDAECRAGQTCTGASGDAQPDGYCTCDVNGDCAAGYGCAADGLCRMTCSTSATCPMSLACTSGFCAGQCTCPCDVTSCSTDADCPAVTWTNNYGTMSAKGKCVTGKCDQCNISVCSSTTAYRHAFDFNYARHRVGTYQARYYRALNDLIVSEGARNSEPASSLPLVIPVTVPHGPAEEYPTCRTIRGSIRVVPSPYNALRPFADRMAQQMLSEFDHVVDVRAAVDAVPLDRCWVDQIHPGIECAAAWGTPIGDYATSLNSCVLNGALARYCQNSDGTWDAGNVVCGTDGDCTGTDRCRQRVCSTNDDAATGCPGSPTCRLEATP
jgi:hypothetical protein